MIKKNKLRKTVNCFTCNRQIKAGQKAVIVYDYMDIPYNDKCFCNERCLGLEEKLEAETYSPREGNA